MKKFVIWVIVSIVGVILALGSVFFNLWVLPIFVRRQVGETLALKNGSAAWDRFVDVPIVPTMNVYIFNVVNPKEMVKGAKPKVSQVGPYVYKEYRSKQNLSLSETSDTVSYRQKINFVFDEEASYPLTEDDIVTPINMIPHYLMEILDRLPYVNIIQEAFQYGYDETMVKIPGPVMNLTVRDYLFDGFPMICNSSSMSFAAKAICAMVDEYSSIKYFTPTADGNYIGAVLRYKNDTTNGYFTINRGIEDSSKVGQIVAYDGEPTIKAWATDSCNSAVGGYDETIYPPYLSRSSQFGLYQYEICTTTPMAYAEKVKHFGISGYRFSVGDRFFGSVQNYPEHSCYCPGRLGNITRAQGCLRDGILDISSCAELPIILSRPHFYKADTFYTNMVEGLDTSSTYDTYLDLEPWTGIPLVGSKKLQFNIFVKPMSSMPQYAHLRPAIVPFAWFEEKLELGTAQISMLKNQLLVALNIASIIEWVLVAVGALLAVLGVVMATIHVKKDHSE